MHNSGVCATVDVCHVNHAIKPTNIPIQCVEDIKKKLSSCTYFS